MARRATYRIKTSEIEYVAHQLAKELMEWGEPIPEFDTRFPNVLESCLATPFQTFQRKNLYRGVIKKASILFYLIIKNHPFQNGNKRVAVTTLLYFLYKNKRWMDISNDELYKFAVEVAESDQKYKDKYLEKIENFLGENVRFRK